ncbi:MAG: metallophosphoesterase family protein [Anaerovibrio sp.]|nr:metallophosphoesterase family protein [Anaerovibrio sp.]
MANKENGRKFTRYKLLGIAAGVFIAVGIVLAGLWAAEKNCDAAVQELPGVKFVRQVVSQDNQTGRTVMWQTEKPMNAPGVEYRLFGDGAGDSKKVAAKAENFTDDGVTVTLYTAELTGLPQGKQLEYRIIGSDGAGPWHSLQLDAGKGFSALIFPDSQSNNYSGWKSLAQGAAERHPQAEFFINMGDLVDNGEDHRQWTAWLDSVEGIIDRIPVAPVMGNHETYNMDWKVRQPAAYLQEFAVPGNGSSQYNRFYYSYDYGPVHFIVLNTQQGELEELSPELLAEQIAWFRRDAAASAKPWKVVLMHKDPLQYRIHNRPERTEGFSEEGQIWMPLFDEVGIDAVLSAHLHTYRNRGHIKNFQHAADGPLYILTGVAGNVRYPGLWIDHALDEYVAPQPETDNYMVMEASQEELNFFAYLSDGTLLDHAVVKH